MNKILQLNDKLSKRCNHNCWNYSFYLPSSWEILQSAFSSTIEIENILKKLSKRHSREFGNNWSDFISGMFKTLNQKRMIYALSLLLTWQVPSNSVSENAHSKSFLHSNNLPSSIPRPHGSPSCWPVLKNHTFGHNSDNHEY